MIDSPKKCEDGKLWLAVIFHLDRLIQLQSNSADYFERRGAARAQLNEWDPALDDFAQAVERGVSGPNNLHSIAVLYLNAGRLDDYRRICRLTLEQIDPKTNPMNINTRVWTCSLVDAAVSDPAKLISFLEAVARRSNNCDRR